MFLLGTALSSEWMLFIWLVILNISYRRRMTVNAGVCTDLQHQNKEIHASAVSSKYLYVTINNYLYQFGIDTLNGQSHTLLFDRTDAEYKKINLKNKLPKESFNRIPIHSMFVITQKNSEYKCFVEQSQLVNCYSEDDDAKLHFNNFLDLNSRLFLNASQIGAMIEFTDEEIRVNKGRLDDENSTFITEQILTLFTPDDQKTDYFVLIASKEITDISKLKNDDFEQYRPKGYSGKLVNLQTVNLYTKANGFFFNKHYYIFTPSWVLVFMLDYDNFDSIQITQVTWVTVEDFFMCNKSIYNTKLSRLNQIFMMTVVISTLIIIVLVISIHNFLQKNKEFTDYIFRIDPLKRNESSRWELIKNAKPNDTSLESNNDNSAAVTSLDIDHPSK